METTSTIDIGPRVTIAPRLEIKGHGSLSEILNGRGVRLKTSPLRQAILTRYSTPALLYNYSIKGTVYSARLNKGILDEVGESQIEVRTITLDYDRPYIDGRKNPWASDDECNAFMDRLTAITGGMGSLSDWYAMAQSRNGLRMFYALSKPVGPTESESIVAGVIGAFSAKGIEFDKSGIPWNHGFKLPRIKHDGMTTIADPLIRFRQN